MHSETWYKLWCPECNTPNWICNGDVADLTILDIDAVECYNCKHRFWLGDPEEFSDENPEEKLAAGDAMIERGRPNPDDPYPGMV